MADLVKALAYCLQNEKGFANNPQDHGGPTNRGITIAMFAKFRGRMVSIQELQSISDQDVYLFYEEFFWNANKLSGLPQVIATAILDTAINQGGPAAVKLAQEALGYNVIADGKMGSDTLNSLDRCNPQEFLYNYIGLIQDKYAKICVNASNQLIFLEGWLRRSRRLFTLVLFP